MLREPSTLGNLKRPALERRAIGAIGSFLAVFLLAPLVALCSTISGPEFLSGITSSGVWPALRLSLITTSSSLAIAVLFGTPLAWVLALTRSRTSRGLETLLQLPIVIPPAVAGIALLLTFGRHGLLTGRLFPGTLGLGFTTAAVVMAEVFVSAPFYVQSALSAFRRIDPKLLVVAESLGAYPWRVFLLIAIPMARPGLVAGAALSWARALGEFGATLMFAGNLQGKTQTLPLAIYSALESDLHAAQAVSILLVAVALGLLVVVRARMTEASLTGDADRAG